ncbi:MAG TPA: carboxypeptidase regulatory-like domain-containing protein, partial [Candidatus Solibacter sp.]|nr:carboxypeptidase regulatory-like domain-containing protein [Candidatus Solibacter sp.]
MMRWLFSLLLLAALPLPAQDIFGNIGGTILDPAGAAVPNATVTITDSERNQIVRTVTTGDTGTYSVPLIPFGVYTIKVAASGFRTEERRGVVLNVGDDLRINIRIKVGIATEAVEVQAEAVAVELGSPASGTTVEGQQIRELALGTRNYEELVALMPGVSPNATDDLYVGNSLPSGAANAVPFAINGSRTSANNWTVDGADNVDRGSNLTLQTFPSVDAIAQFKVDRSLYTADSGRAGGGQINVVTRGGVRKFHGDVHEFFRNDALNANAWTNNANKVNLRDSASPLNNCTLNFTSTCYAKNTPVRWNNYGFTIGGPVYFGKRFNKGKNKTFFFYSQEFRKIINYATFNPTALPSVSMLSGTMIQPVCITTLTGCPSGSTPVTQIPANLINPNSAAYIKDILSRLPLLDGPTTASTTGLFFPVRNIFDSRQEMARIDHQFRQGFNIWGRLTIDDIPTTEAGGLFGLSSVPNMATTRTNSPGRGVVFHAVNTFGKAIVNDGGFNFSQSAILTTPVGLSARANSPDINPTMPFPNPEGVVPTVTFSSGSSINGSGPYVDYNRNYTAFDNLTWIKGRHTIKFGINENRYNKTENARTGQGSFGFTNAGAPSGTSAFQQAFANFLLGNVATFSQPSMDITPDIWAWQTETYAQDDFKIAPRLTLYVGMRWSYFGQPTDTNHLLSNFDPGSYDAAKTPQINTTNGTVVPGTKDWQLNGIVIGGVNSRFGDKIANDNWHNFAPRIGLAWDPFGRGKMSIRTGWGVYHDATLFGTYEQNIFANPPYISSVSYSNASFSNVAGGTLGLDP